MEILQHQYTRKEILKLGLLGSAALFLPLERTARTQVSIEDRLPESQLPTPFILPFAIPPKATKVSGPTRDIDYYRITMKSAQVQILPKSQGFKPTTIYGYNGITPGPTIVAEQGRGAVVRQINALPSTSPSLYEGKSHTSVHLHGSDSLPQYDGYASDKTDPGYYKDYHYPNNQNARTLWYHDHGVHHTAENAYMGLAAQYHLHDPLEKSLPIPKDTYDVPLIIRDAIFAKDSSLIYDDDGHSGIFGDVLLVNGVPWPVIKVERRKYRFRVLNASVSRSYKLALSTGEPLTVIGHDGGLAPAPQDTSSLRLGQAERYEIVIDFAKYKVGQQVILKNLSNPNNVDFNSTTQIMRFDVTSEPRSTANNTVPSTLNPNNEIMNLTKSNLTVKPGAPGSLENPRKLEVIRQGGEWTVNEKTWADIENSQFKETFGLTPARNAVEVWELKNGSGGWFHPLHIHLIDFKILDRNGKAPFAWEKGPKDVAYLGENESVRVISKFGPNEGRYMVHCHNLVHEDHDMMIQFRVGPDKGDNDPNDPIKADPAKLYVGSPPMPSFKGAVQSG